MERLCKGKGPRNSLAGCIAASLWLLDLSGVSAGRAEATAIPLRAKVEHSKCMCGLHSGLCLTSIAIQWQEQKRAVTSYLRFTGAVRI